MATFIGSTTGFVEGGGPHSFTVAISLKPVSIDASSMAEGRILYGFVSVSLRRLREEERVKINRSLSKP